MATTMKPPLQDMPPSGGYAPLQTERVKLKTVFGTKLTIGIYLVSTISGLIGFYFNRKQVERERVEMRSARFAMLPMLLAERDRAFLKQCKINRDTERELMKNDPEWEVGTYYREPVYRTTQKFIESSYEEFMAHADHWEVAYRCLHRHFF